LHSQQPEKDKQIFDVSPGKISADAHDRELFKPSNDAENHVVSITKKF